MICKRNIFSLTVMGFVKFCEIFTYADLNHTYSNLLHLIYHVANYLELRHVVSNSHRAMV